MLTVGDVTDYIDSNVLHSKLYDEATPAVKAKAVNQSVNTLYRVLKGVYGSIDNVPLEDVVEQVLWILRIDDSLQRAEMGTTSIDIDGMSIQMESMDRTIAPLILKTHGVTDIRKRRVGSYATHKADTFRQGNYDYDPRYYRY